MKLFRFLSFSDDKDIQSGASPPDPMTYPGRESRAIYPWNVYGSEDGGVQTNSGQRVSEITAFKYSVAWAAMTLIADGVASLPPQAFRVDDKGNRQVTDLPQWIRSPHPDIRRFDVWNQLMLSVLAWGNAYALFMRRPSDGQIIGLNVLDPASVECEWDGRGFRQYRISGNGAWLTGKDVFHIQGPTLPGDPKGMSVIAMNREAIGLGLTLEEFGSRYFRQGSQAKLILEIPQKVKDSQEAKKIIDVFEMFHKGKGQWHRPAIASGGVKIHNVTIPPEDAQFLETRRFQAHDVARWFRVPPHRVGITDGTSMWGSGLAEENQAMLQHTYRPWIIRFEAALTKYTPFGEDSGVFIELQTDALMRGTYKEQADVQTSLYKEGLITRDEARKPLGFGPASDGGSDFVSASDVPPTPDPRTPEQDRLRKQQEAQRDAFPSIFDHESRDLSTVDRVVVKHEKLCNQCLANDDPANVPVHPGCQCDVRTDNVELAVGESDHPLMQAIMQEGNDFKMMADVVSPDGVKLDPRSIAVIDAEELRYGDMTKWLEQAQGLLNQADYVAVAIDEGHQQIQELSAGVEITEAALRKRIWIATAKALML